MKFNRILACVICISGLVKNLFCFAGALPEGILEERLGGRIFSPLQAYRKIPLASPDDNVTVTVALSLLRVQSVNPVDSAEIDVWLRMRWTDIRLSWKSMGLDPRFYRTVSMPVDKLWHPDIRPDSVLGFHPDRELTDRAIITMDGRVTYTLPARIRFQCTAQMKNWFITCEMNLSSWSYPANQVDLRLDGSGIGLDQYRSSLWNVTKPEAERIEDVFSTGSRVAIRYSVELQSNRFSNPMQ